MLGSQAYPIPSLVWKKKTWANYVGKREILIEER